MKPLLCVVTSCLAATACVRTGDIVVRDSKTALEQQAAGSFPELEDAVDQAALSPGPVPLVRSALSQAGEGSGATAFEESLDAATVRARIDDLLLRRCVGEARDATLVETPATCTGTVDAVALGRLVERENRDRFQVWRYLQRQRPKATLEEIRRTWRAIHLDAVICGGAIEGEPGQWAPKRC